jgi:hypothetical protein
MPPKQLNPVLERLYNQNELAPRVDDPAPPTDPFSAAPQSPDTVREEDVDFLTNLGNTLRDEYVGTMYVGKKGKALLGSGARGFAESIGVNLDQPSKERGGLEYLKDVVVSSGGDLWKGLVGLPGLVGGVAEDMTKILPSSMFLYNKERRERHGELLEELAKDSPIGAIAEAVTEGPVNIGRGIQERDPHKIAYGTGQTAGILADVLLGKKGLGVAGRAPVRGAQRAARRARRGAEADMARALNPSGPWHKSLTEKISPELIRRGEQAWTGRGFDNRIERKVKETGQAVERAKAAIPEDTLMSYQPIVSKLVVEVEHLKALWPLLDTRKMVKKINARIKGFLDADIEVPAHNLIEKRRLMDKKLEAAKRFKRDGSPALSSADQLDLVLDEYIANLLREEINSAFPVLEAANFEHWLYQTGHMILDQKRKSRIGQQIEPLVPQGAMSFKNRQAIQMLGLKGGTYGAMGFLGGLPGLGALLAFDMADMARRSRGTRSKLAGVKEGVLAKPVLGAAPIPDPAYLQGRGPRSIREMMEEVDLPPEDF